jgi:hypothetical protein
MMVGAYLQIPRISDKCKLKERFEKRMWQHFFCSNSLGMAGYFDRDFVVSYATQLAGYPHGKIVRVLPSMPL